MAYRDELAALRARTEALEAELVDAQRDLDHARAEIDPSSSGAPTAPRAFHAAASRGRAGWLALVALLTAGAGGALGGGWVLLGLAVAVAIGLLAARQGTLRHVSLSSTGLTVCGHDQDLDVAWREVEDLRLTLERGEIHVEVQRAGVRQAVRVGPMPAAQQQQLDLACLAWRRYARALATPPPEAAHATASRRLR